MLYEKREKFEGTSRKIGIFFSKLGLSPNQLTFLSIISALITFYFLTQQNFIYSALFFALTSIFDVADGAVARLKKKVTNKGAYYDTIADRYTEFIIIAGLFFANLFSLLLPASFWLLLYLFGAMMTTYAKAAAKEKNLVKEEIRGGILERGERMILLFFSILLAPFAGKVYVTYVIIILAVLSNITALQRIRMALKCTNK